MEPLSDGKRFGIANESLRIIFPSSLQVILKTNETLHEKLSQRLSSVRFVSLLFLTSKRHHSCVGDIFIEMAPFLKCYVPFINAYEASREAIANLRKTNKKFEAYLKEVFLHWICLFTSRTHFQI